MKRTICMLVLLLLLGTAVQAMAQTLELTSGREEGHPTVAADRLLAENLSSFTSGLEIEVSCGGTLYGEEQGLLEALQKGDVAMGHVSFRALQDSAEGLELFSLPYLFTGDEHLEAVLWGTIGNRLVQEIGERCPGLIVLGFYNCGGRCFYSREQIASPYDLEGKLLCTEQTKAMEEYLTVSGARQTTLGRHMVYSALQQGAIDGAENDLVSLAYLGDYDGARYILLDRHTYAPEVLLLSRRIAERLSDEELDALRRAALMYTSAEWNAWKEAEQAAIATFRDYGCTLTEMDTSLLEAFKGKAKEASTALGGRSVYDRISSQKELGSLLKEIEDLGAAYLIR